MADSRDPVLILSDIHNRTHLIDQILAHERWARVICTGDIFDSYGDSVVDATQTAYWLADKLDNQNFTFLAGNHDLGYLWPTSPAADCSGFTRAKCEAIRRVVGEKRLVAGFKLHHVESGILFTHAGVHRDLLTLCGAGPVAMTLEGLDEYLTSARLAVEAKLGSGRSHPLVEAGYDRGGWQTIGGLTWCDFSNHVPIPGVRQILGHSPQPRDKGPLMRFVGAEGVPVAKYVTSRIKPEWMARGWSLCMDTHSHHYAVLEDGKLRVMTAPSERKFGDDTYTLSTPDLVQEITL